MKLPPSNEERARKIVDTVLSPEAIGNMDAIAAQHLIIQAVQILVRAKETRQLGLKLSTVAAWLIPAPLVLQQSESLKVISNLNSVIGMLEHKWERPHSEAENAIMQTLSDIRETVRRAHEAQQSKAAHDPAAIGDEYCWVHEGPGNGGWTCQACREEKSHGSK